MKKKLEAELISIAHRILQLKNKSDLLQLHKETQNLYEKLSLLKFVEENFADAKPTIGHAEIESQIESVFDKEDEAETAEAPETKSENETEDKKEDTAAEVTDATETREEDKSEETEASDTGDEENTETETPESSGEETAEAETSEASDTAATEEPASSEEENTETEPAASSESEETPAATDEIEIPETPEQPESLEEVQSALEYTNTDEIEEGEEIPAAEDAGVSKAGDTAPKEEDFAPSFELAFDKKDEPKEQKQIAFEDFLGHDYNESFFVKAGEADKKQENPVEEKHEEPEEQAPNETQIPVTEPEIVEEKEPEPQHPEETAPYKPLSEHLSKTITIGLNDRIGFEKQLFGGSSEDLNRVLSQLNTFNTFQEAQDFIEDMVRPDYNWDGKEDYVQRFMDIVEKKFV